MADFIASPRRERTVGINYGVWRGTTRDRNETASSALVYPNSVSADSVASEADIRAEFGQNSADYPFYG
jgi:hypothetical protein